MTDLWAATEQVPDDVGKSGPFGLLLLVLGLIAVGFLVRSMTRHLNRVPGSFDESAGESDVVVPDTPEQLLRERRDEPGEDLLDTLRRAPRAIEPPRDDDPDPGPRG
ncbi:hypothetical protein [Trujillonella endophytica]|uniref:Uncharacterized protein n=1 Tax=Trujillonella endophytica TaxID=673521 RepID=A0A1H8SJA2_9ACTN|nr:hypothetical protein [Trujillella endophytica]SEO78752.1 hypothetical protein SAMN05660991_01769 [Trujillella endophytica]